MALSVAFISFAIKVAIDFCHVFSQLLRILFSLNLYNKRWGHHARLRENKHLSRYQA